MHTSLPDYIVQRVRRPMPVNSAVVPGSTPVVSFGNAQSATIATLGLNPSRQEFLDENGEELAGSSRRLATCQSLGVEDLSRAPEDAIRQVVEDCNTYFRRNPYHRWFNQLERVLKVIDASYYDHSACHLDLVQWATDPAWGKLRLPNVRHQLLESDGPFLLQQLRNEQIRVLLINGRGVIRQLQKLAPVQFREEPPLSVRAYQKPRLFVGPFSIAFWSWVGVKTSSLHSASRMNCEASLLIVCVKSFAPEKGGELDFMDVWCPIQAK